MVIIKARGEEMKPIISKRELWWSKIYDIWEFKKDFKKYLLWKFITTQRTIDERGMGNDNLYYYAQLDLLREINKQYKFRLKALNEIKK